MTCLLRRRASLFSVPVNPGGQGKAVRPDDIAAWLHRAEVPSTAYVVVVTRGHTHDFDALRALAARDLRYLGLIGSRAKVVRVFDALLAEGMPPECLERVHAPIGLDIGAITPAEIAISILAELIAVRHGKDVSSLSMSSARRPIRRAPLRSDS